MNLEDPCAWIFIAAAMLAALLVAAGALLIHSLNEPFDFTIYDDDNGGCDQETDDDETETDNLTETRK